MGKYSNVNTSDIRTSLNSTKTLIEKLRSKTNSAASSLDDGKFLNVKAVDMTYAGLSGICNSKYKGSLDNALLIIDQILPALKYIEKLQAAEGKLAEYKKTAEQSSNGEGAIDTIKINYETHNISSYERKIDKLLTGKYSFKNVETTINSVEKSVGTTKSSENSTQSTSIIYNFLSGIYTKTKNFVVSTYNGAISLVKNIWIDFTWDNDPTIDTYNVPGQIIDNNNDSGDNTEPEEENNEYNEDSGEEINNEEYDTPQKTSGIFLKGKTTADGYGPAFLNKVKQIAQKHNIDYKQLLALMNAESSINPAADNGVGYVGFMQFGDDAAAEIGTTRAELAQMDPMEQLDYVDKRISVLETHIDERPITGGDLYAANFLPYRANRQVITDSSESYYQSNKGLDINNDGKITIDEMDARINNFMVDESSFAD